MLQNFVIIVADKGAAGEHIRIGAFQAAEILLGRKIAECRIGFGAGKSKIACVPDAVAPLKVLILYSSYSSGVISCQSYR